MSNSITTRETAPTGFSYFPDLLTEEEQTGLLGRLRELKYEHDRFRGNYLKRGYAQFGYAYVSVGRKVHPAPPWPEFLAALAEKVLPYAPEGSRFNQCIVTHYPAGAGIGWHPDAPVFGDCIAAVSLGHPARLQFRSNGDTEVAYEVLAAPGSLYVMCGEARWDYQHQVVNVKAERYSVTFRWVQDRSERTRGESI